MTDEPILKVDDLQKHFYENQGLLTRLRPDQEVKTVRAVDGVDLTIQEGETLGLVGESGCGKSTLARSVLRLTEPTDGSIRYRETDVTEFSERELRSFRSEAQMVFQDPFSSLNPRYTVRETVVEPMKVHGIGESSEDRDQRARELIERVGLDSEHLDRYPHEFSGGQRQRISIARALAVEPQVIVADEPVSALDVSVQMQILNLLNELQEEMGLTMLFISHNLSIVRQICDRVAVMYLGEIVERAETATLFEDPKHPYSEVLVSSIPIPDPTVERDNITLEGDVPTPIDPPSGCRFHPRCPKVIPPDDWAHDQELWRRILRLKASLETGEVNLNAIRSKLESQTESPVSEEDVKEDVLEEYVIRANVEGADRVQIPPEVADDLDRALSAVFSDDDPVEILDRSYSSICESTVPSESDVSDHRSVNCHLHDEELKRDQQLSTVVTADEH
ncbi:ABC transporter ATP-binding protein [Halostella pelagica]|uniref:ABC transporter ATP-binding protein n=1 Tax=Halostella pelagica TaxID=2583824 RepID=UPI0010802264|nr:ABC transporter ATP-binding protein [Halostella pelagica]